MKQVWASITLAAALGACATTVAVNRPAAAPPQINDAYFQAASKRINATPAPAHARNVILFVGDGMGVTTVTAARIYAGQAKGVDGESYNLTLDTFPHVALSRTYGNDAQISDSAPTATALMSGVKTDEGVIGVTGDATPGQCEGSMTHVSRSLFEIAAIATLAAGGGVLGVRRCTRQEVFATAAKHDIEPVAFRPVDQLARNVLARGAAGARGDHVVLPVAVGGVGVSGGGRGVGGR